MKRLSKILLIAAALFFIIAAGGFYYIKSIPVPAMELGVVDISKIENGEYLGEYNSGPVKVVVNVTVAGGKVVNIDIMEHQNGLGKNAEKITEDIISKQTLQLDSISGATYSSRVILKAVENALQKGKL